MKKKLVLETALQVSLPSAFGVLGETTGREGCQNMYSRCVLGEKRLYEQITLVSSLAPEVCSSVIFRRKEILLYLQMPKLLLPLEPQRLLLK